MSNLQPTAEKSVQTHDSSGSTTLLMHNNPENTAAEVANTLVSMATGRAGGAHTFQQMVGFSGRPFDRLCLSVQNVINVPNLSSSSSLPILSLADYTTSQGVPTAMALASQAKSNPQKQDNSLDDGINSMSTEEYQEVAHHSNASKKNRRGKLNKTISTSKSGKDSAINPIQYGPILVKPRKRLAPTLANGRKSKDTPVSIHRCPYTPIETCPMDF